MSPLGTDPRQQRRTALSLPPGLARRTAKRLAGLRITREDFTAEEQYERWNRPNLFADGLQRPVNDGPDQG